MYSTLLIFHSLFRWLLLVSLLAVVYLAYRGWFGGKPFSPVANRLRSITAILAHIQLLVGVWLYFISPMVDFYFQHLSDAARQRAARFFAMEHSAMMLIAIVLITIGSAAAKRKETDTAKFRTLAIWFSIALLIILATTPWPFSPMAARPYFRFF